MVAAKTLPIKLPARYADSGLPPMRGGFGEARILHDAWLDRAVLLKTIHVPTAKAQLEREIQALAEIRSKHVVALYDVVRGEGGQVDAVVYEYLPGEDLALNSFPEGKIQAAYLKVIYQLICGIADIHAANIVH